MASSTLWPDEEYKQAAQVAGRTSAVLLLTGAQWVHRRAETIDVLGTELARRRTSVDFTVPAPLRSNLEIAPDQFVVQLRRLRSKRFATSNMRDERGRAVPVLGRDQNGEMAHRRSCSRDPHGGAKAGKRRDGYVHEMTYDIQVSAAHYDWSSYNIKGRWVSYWHQIDEVLRTGAKSCLEIGTGTGTVRDVLRGVGVDVTCVDIDAELGVDRVGDVRSLPCEDGEFDVVLCSQVLEHLPWNDVPVAIGELRRVTRGHAVVSLPQAGRTVFAALDLPVLGRHGLLTRLPPRSPLPPGGQHHWEVGVRGTGRRAVRAALQERFSVLNEYTVAEFAYHRFYVLHRR